MVELKDEPDHEPPPQTAQRPDARSPAAALGRPLPGEAPPGQASLGRAALGQAALVAVAPESARTAAPAPGPQAVGPAALSHFDAAGQAHMVDVGAKAPTQRLARASGAITMAPATLALIQSGTAGKGDVLGVARIAAIQAAKRTAELIPLCHNVPISSIRIAFELVPQRSCVVCSATVETYAPTGVEMEALTAVQIGLLTIYDMCKAADRGMVMGDIGLREKRGGASGTWTA